MKIVNFGLIGNADLSRTHRDQENGETILFSLKKMHFYKNARVFQSLIHLLPKEPQLRLQRNHLNCSHTLIAETPSSFSI